MSHVYKAVEWQSSTGKWYVADTSDLARDSAVWWLPPFIFSLSFEDYIKMLVEKYHITSLSYNNDVLLFSWTNHADAHRYLLDINRIARNKNFVIC